MKIEQSILYAPCPCGSGRKFKFCCLDFVRDALSDDPSQSEVTELVRMAMSRTGLPNGVDPVGDKRAIALMQRGVRELVDRRPGKAINLFRQARVLQPSLYTAWNGEAQCLWMKRKADEAIRCQKEGLGYTADMNSFGWAQLSEFHHYLDQDDERDQCADRAKSIPAISGDAATKVCEALALAARHSDLLDYALGCGYPDTPSVTFFAAVAAANCGDFTKSLSLLEGLSADSIPDGGRIEDLRRDLTHNRKDSATPFGTWPYFGLITHPLRMTDQASRKRDVSAIPSPNGRNALCDTVELLFCYAGIGKTHALELLKSVGGDRVERLRTALSALDDNPRGFPPEALGDDDEEDDGPDSVAFLTGQRFHIQTTRITEERNEDDLLSDADHEAFDKATGVIQTANPGSKAWNAARESLRDLVERNPAAYRVEFNYASALFREGRGEEARNRISAIAAAHPGYGFAHAALLNLAIAEGDFGRARKIIRRYRIPEEVHPEEYITWLQATVSYYDLMGEDKAVKTVKKTIRDIKKAFDIV